MNTLEEIVDALAAALELERDLGTRTVEIDRDLLAPVAASAPEFASAPPVPAPAAPAPAVVAPMVAPAAAPAVAPAVRPAASAPAADGVQVVFLHDRGLDAAGGEMIAKIAGALGLAGRTAVVTAPPLPPARVYVVLGARALRRFFPGTVAEPGAWIAAANGVATLVTYAPEYILRFRTVTPAVAKIKTEMWRSLKGIPRRMQNGQ